MLALATPARLHPLPITIESRSPGKERDSETGFDYIGARYNGEGPPFRPVFAKVSLFRNRNKKRFRRVSELL